jgi:hypothetical protein
MGDPVNSPDHYTAGGIETIDYLRAKLTPEEYRGFLLGNALKYLSRAGRKGDALEDYRKGAWYLERLIAEIARFTRDERAAVLESVANSQALSGVTVAYAQAGRLLDEIEGRPLPYIGVKE